MSLLYRLSKFVLVTFISDWCKITAFGDLDSAWCNHKEREWFHTVCTEFRQRIFADYFAHSAGAIRWYASRGWTGPKKVLMNALMFDNELNLRNKKLFEVDALRSYLSNATHVKITDIKEVPLLQYCPCLQEVSISYARGVAQRVPKFVCPPITALILSGPALITKFDLLTKLNVTELQKIVVTGDMSGGLSQRAAAIIAKSCQRTLTCIEWNAKYNTTTMMSLIDECPNLTNLIVKDSFNVDKLTFFEDVRRKHPKVQLILGEVDESELQPFTNATRHYRRGVRVSSFIHVHAWHQPINSG